MGLSIGRVMGAIELDDQFTSKLHAAASQLDQFSQKADRVGARMQSMGLQLSAISLAITGTAAVSLKTFADFERGMNKVQALTSATGQQFDALSDQAKKLGATTQFTAREASEAMGFMAMAGFDVNSVMGAMPSVLQLAASAQMDMGRAADITTNILTGYGLQVEDLGHANDVLVKAFTSANTNLEQLGQAFKFAGPLAKSAGVSFEETAATLALMGNAGIQASMAGTSFRGALTRLLNPTKQVQEAMASIGLTVKDTTGRLLPFDQILQQLEPHAENAGLMMAIFGQRAGPAMAALVGQGSEALRDLTDKLKDSGGVAQRVAETQMKGLRGAWIQLTSAAEGLQIALGEKLGPVALVIVQRFTDLARFAQNVLLPAFVALPVPVQAVAIGLLALVAAAGPALLALGSLVRLSGIAAEGFVALVRWTTFLGNTIPVLTARVWLLDASAKASLVSTQALTAAKLYWSGVLTTLGNALGLATARTITHDAATRASVMATTTLAAAKTRLVVALTTAATATGLAAARLWVYETAAKAATLASNLLAAAKLRLAGVLLAASLNVNILATRLGLMGVAQRVAAVSTALMGGSAAGAATGVTALRVALGSLLALSVIVPLLAGIAAGIYKIGEATRDAWRAWQEGRLWEHLSAKDSDNWVRRWFGLAYGIKRTKEEILDASQALKLFHAEQQRGMDRLTGVDVTRQASDIGLHLGRLNEQGKLTPAIVKKAADEIKGLVAQGAQIPAVLRDIDALVRTAEQQVSAGLRNKVNEIGLQVGRLSDTGKLTEPALQRLGVNLAKLEAQGATLPPHLAKIAREFGQMAPAAAMAAKSTTPFSESIARVQKELAALDAASRRELTIGAQSFDFERFKELATTVPGAAKLSEDALRKFFDQVKEGTKAGEKLNGWMNDFRSNAAKLETQLQMAAAAGVPMTIVLEEFGSEIEKTANRAPILGHQMGEFTRRAFNAQVAERYAEALRVTHAEQRKLHEEVQKDALDRGMRKMEAYADATLKNAKAIESAQLATQQLNRQFEVQTIEVKLRNVSEEFERQRKAITAMEMAAGLYKERMDALADQEIAAREAVYQAWLRGGELTRRELEVTAADAVDRYHEMKRSGEFTADAVYRAWKDAYDKIIALHQTATQRFLSGMRGAMSGMAEHLRAIGEMTGGKLSAFAQWFGVVAKSQDLAAESGYNFARAQVAWQDGHKAEAIADMATSVMGLAAAFMQATEKGNAFQKALGGMMVGAQFGAQFGPIGAAIGAAAGFLAGLVRGLLQPEWKKVMKDVGRDWGVTISEELAKAIAEDSKKIGRLDAPLLHLDKIFAEAGGVEAFGVGKAIEKARQLFSAIERGSITSQQAVSQLNKVFPELAAAATDANGLVSTSFLELIDLSKQFGLQVQGVAEFVDQQAQRLSAGLNKAIGGVFAGFQKEFHGAFKGLDLPEDVIKGLFDGLGDTAKMRAATKAYEEALKEANKEVERALLEKHGIEVVVDAAQATDDISALQSKLRSTDLTFRESSNDVARLTQKLEDMRRAGKSSAAQLEDVALQIERAQLRADNARSSIDRLTQELKALGATGDGKQLMKVLPPELQKELERRGANISEILTKVVERVQPQFDRLSRIALGSFNALVAAGQTPVDAINAIGDSVDHLIDLQKKLGSVIPPKSAEEAWAGLGDAITSLSDEQRHMLERDYEIARAAGQTADSFEKFVLAQANLYQTLQEGDPALLTTFLGDDLAKILEFQARAEAAMKGVGLASNAAFEQLARWRTLVKENEPLVNQMAGLNDIIVGLANLGGLSPDLFADLQEEAQAVRQQLLDVGFTEQETLAQMAPMLETILKLHYERGLAIDDETKKLIEQADQAGLLSSNAMSMNQILIDGFAAMIDALGGKLPEAFERFRAKAIEAGKQAGDGVKTGVEKGVLEAQKILQAEEAWKEYQRLAKQAGAAAGTDLQTALQTKLDELQSEFGDIWATFGRDAKNAGQAAADAVNGIPRKLSIDIDYNERNSPSGAAAAQAATGGLVTATTILPFVRGGVVPQYLDTGGTAAALPTGGKLIPFIPKGTDTVPAMLTPGEGVVTVAAMQRLEPAGLKALNRGESLPAPVLEKLMTGATGVQAEAAAQETPVAEAVERRGLARTVLPVLQAAAASLMLLAAPVSTFAAEPSSADPIAAMAARSTSATAVPGFQEGGVVHAALGGLVPAILPKPVTSVLPRAASTLAAAIPTPNRTALTAPAIPSTVRGGSTVTELVERSLSIAQQVTEIFQRVPDLSKRAESVLAQDLPPAIQDLQIALDLLGPDAATAATQVFEALQAMRTPTLTVALVFAVQPPDLTGIPEQVTAGKAIAAGRATGASPTFLATGGLVDSAPGARAAVPPFAPRGTDTVPAMLTPGEGVLTVAAMRRLEPAGLQALNRGEPLPARIVEKVTATGRRADEVRLAVSDELAVPQTRSLALARSVLPALQAAASTLAAVGGSAEVAAGGTVRQMTAAETPVHLVTGGVVPRVQHLASGGVVPALHLATGGAISGRSIRTLPPIPSTVRGDNSVTGLAESALHTARMVTTTLQAIPADAERAEASLRAELPLAISELSISLKLLVPDATSTADQVSKALAGITAPTLTITIDFAVRQPDLSGLPAGVVGVAKGSASKAAGLAMGGLALAHPFAGGGPIDGRHTVAEPVWMRFERLGTDTVPAMLTPGEGVLTVAAMQRVGLDGLDALNTGHALPPERLQMLAADSFSRGGAVQAVTPLATGGPVQPTQAAVYVPGVESLSQNVARETSAAPVTINARVTVQGDVRDKAHAREIGVSAGRAVAKALRRNTDGLRDELGEEIVQIVKSAKHRGRLS